MMSRLLRTLQHDVRGFSHQKCVSRHQPARVRMRDERMAPARVADADVEAQWNCSPIRYHLFVSAGAGGCVMASAAWPSDADFLKTAQEVAEQEGFIGADFVTILKGFF